MNISCPTAGKLNQIILSDVTSSCKGLNMMFRDKHTLHFAVLLGQQKGTTDH